ncbi:50S ribosomal protein L13 [Blattabacterium cuenoti]|uniref:50S ribosomal protein L13 n=1 Tax=Blattabacterium cuenoti TaxID=1653831 RepID=UPI00163CFA19|nr:50S ribosomal protein L13 [Blattabacterium cuenoti]
MDPLSFKTDSGKNFFHKKKWIIMDANHQKLGRFSSEIAFRIKGKDKPFFSPNFDCGDYIIVINSDQIQLTGKKWLKKKYIRYTGYPGGKRITTVKDLFKKDSRILIYKAVKGMLPKNRLGKKMIKKLRIYKGKDHKHNAQNPVLLKNYNNTI